MTKQELEEKIKEKFLSILYKLSKFIMDDLTENFSPQFRYLISGCMEVMEREHLNFDIEEQARISYNNLFARIGSRCRITQIHNIRVIGYESRINNLDQLKKIYNVFNEIDNLLSKLDKTKQFITIISDIAPLFNEINVNPDCT